MIQRIVQNIKLLKKINIIQFFFLNYFCKSVIRMDNSKIIPYKNTIIDIEPGAKIYLSGGDIEIGCDLLKKSKMETRIRLREKSLWSSFGGCKISYGSTIEILQDAIFDCKFFTMNSNSTIIVAEKITLGRDVMIGRNVVVYDSDHHQILDKNGEIINYSKPVVIGDHVWLATNVLILKGTSIGSGSVIGANSIVSSAVDEKTIYGMEQKKYIRKDYRNWDRKSPGYGDKYEYDKKYNKTHYV